jgi:hypothetical protein
VKIETVVIVELRLLFALAKNRFLFYFILFYFYSKNNSFPVESEGEGGGLMVCLHRLDMIDAGPSQDQKPIYSCWGLSGASNSVTSAVHILFPWDEIKARSSGQGFG